MKKRNKLNNKGFSLVELIIVMAIMAILVGAVTPQVIKYVEKSREAKDLQVLQTVFTAAQTTILTNEGATTTTYKLSDIYAKTGGNFTTTEGIPAEIRGLLGDANLTEKFTSKKAKNTDGSKKDIYIAFDVGTGELEVGIGTSKTDSIKGIGPIKN